MADDNESGLGDDRGHVGAPAAGQVTPSTNSDAPPGRPERTTGAGAEATTGTDGRAAGDATEHRSGYGGEGGEPVQPSDVRD